MEPIDLTFLSAQCCSDLGRVRISEPHPDRLRRRTVEKSELAEVGVLGDDEEIVFACVLSDLGVGRRVETEFCDMAASGV